MNQSLTKDEEIILALQRVKGLYQQKQFQPNELGKEDKRRHNLKCLELIIESYEMTNKLNENQVDLAIRIINEVNQKENLT
jgi:hypothetical protein